MVWCTCIERTVVSTAKLTYNALFIEPLLVGVVISQGGATFPEQLEFGGCLLFSAAASQVSH